MCSALPCSGRTGLAGSVAITSSPPPEAYQQSESKTRSAEDRASGGTCALLPMTICEQYSGTHQVLNHHSARRACIHTSLGQESARHFSSGSYPSLKKPSLTVKALFPDLGTMIRIHSLKIYLDLCS